MSKTRSEIRHDLKNPLAVIKGYAQLLSAKLKDQPSMAKYADKIDTTCNQLIDRINELLPDD